MNKDNPPPKRAFEIKIRISADCWASALDELEFLAGELLARGPDCESVSGGVHSGHIVEVEENPEITPEIFREQLRKYNARRIAQTKK